jgi:hypothetical protein
MPLPMEYPPMAPGHTNMWDVGESGSTDLTYVQECHSTHRIIRELFEVAAEHHRNGNFLHMITEPPLGCLLC